MPPRTGNILKNLAGTESVYKSDAMKIETIFSHAGKEARRNIQNTSTKKTIKSLIR